MNIKNKYKEIKKDIIDNLNEVFLREYYYTHKYRGDINNDINVSIQTEDTEHKKIQIYLNNQEGYIKDTITVYNPKKYDSVINSNIEEYE